MDFKMKIHECGIQITDVFPKKQSNGQMFPDKLRPNMCVIVDSKAFPNLESQSFLTSGLV